MPPYSSMLQKLLPILDRIANLLPYFLGMIFIWFPIRQVYFDPFLERAAYFVLLFSAWQIFLLVAFRWFIPRTRSNQDRATTGTRSTLRIIGLGIALLGSGAATLLLLEFFKARLPGDHFYVALFALGTLALRRSLVERRQLAGALTALAVACISIGYLSFIIVDPVWKWEPLLPCAGIASLFVARALSESLSSSTSLSLRSYRLASRLTVLFFVLAPTLVTSLCYWGKLSSNFFFLFGIFPLLLPLAESLRANESVGTPPPALAHRSRVIFLSYVAILLFVGLIGRFS